MQRCDLKTLVVVLRPLASYIERHVDILTSDFDYHLPPERIAQTPVEPRDSSRLLVIHRDTGTLEHRVFREIGEYLRPGDLLVANDSRVLPGRLWTRKPTGGRVELLLLRQVAAAGNGVDSGTAGEVAAGEGWWEALVRPASRLHEGQLLTLVSGPQEDRPEAGEVVGSRTAVAEASPPGQAVTGDDAEWHAELGPRTESGGMLVRFDAPLEAVLARFGRMPLPPYIHAPLADPERYQTVYSRVTGSAAAPTAGLHFTPRLLEQLTRQGVRFAFVTLHVGSDTFRPVRAERIVDHPMHAEFAFVPQATAQAIAGARREGRRVVVVGTTAVRALESWAQTWPDGASPLPPTDGDWSAWTRLFIYSGYRFRVVDALLTNFHLPKSTLLMLISAFAGRDLVRQAYAAAIASEYRFYSFGDCCLFL